MLMNFVNFIPTYVKFFIGNFEYFSIWQRTEDVQTCILWSHNLFLVRILICSMHGYSPADRGTKKQVYLPY